MSSAQGEEGMVIFAVRKSGQGARTEWQDLAHRARSEATETGRDCHAREKAAKTKAVATAFLLAPCR